MIYDVFNKKWENVIPAKLNEARLKKKEEGNYLSFIQS